MKTNTILLRTLVPLVIALITGCNNTPPPLPEATKENCEDKNIANSLDKEQKIEFGDKCARRGSLTPTPGGGKSW